MLHHGTAGAGASPTASATGGSFVQPIYNVATIYLTTALYTTPTSSAVVANTLYASPVIVTHPRTFTAAAIHVATLLAGQARIGIYRARDDGLPGDLVIEPTATTPIDTGTAGARTAPAYSQELTPGLYWLAVVFSTTPTMTTYSAGNQAGTNIGASVGVIRGIANAYPFAPLGSLAATTHAGTGVFVPVIGIR